MRRPILRHPKFSFRYPRNRGEFGLSSWRNSQKESDMTDITTVLARADKNLDSSLAKLFELLRIKSISTDPAFKAECRKAADWLVAYLPSIGFTASGRGTAREPVGAAPP